MFCFCYCFLLYFLSIYIISILSVYFYYFLFFILFYSFIYLFFLGDTLVEKHCIRSKPSAIFNCDETGFSGKETYRGKVIVRRGNKHAYQQSVRFAGYTTIHVSASADGKVITPHKYLKTVSLEILSKIYHAFMTFV